jgi:hypothetical protein
MRVVLFQESLPDIPGARRTELGIGLLHVAVSFRAALENPSLPFIPSGPKLLDEPGIFPAKAAGVVLIAGVPGAPAM